MCQLMSFLAAAWIRHANNGAINVAAKSVFSPFTHSFRQIIQRKRNYRDAGAAASGRMLRQSRLILSIVTAAIASL